MVFTADEERRIRKMLALHMQRMKTHALSFRMENKENMTAENIQAHDQEATKCRQIIDSIISEENL